MRRVDSHSELLISLLWILAGRKDALILCLRKYRKPPPWYSVVSFLFSVFKFCCFKIYVLESLCCFIFWRAGYFFNPCQLCKCVVSLSIFNSYNFSVIPTFSHDFWPKFFRDVLLHAAAPLLFAAFSAPNADRSRDPVG